MQHLAKVDCPEICALFFQPPRDSRGHCPENAEDVPLTISDDLLLACRFYLTAPEAPTLIYFHGGSESSDSFAPEAESYNQSGINVFLTSLRGFGESTGLPSFATLNDDAGAQFSEAVKWLAAKKYSGPILVMGRSLGAICALEVAYQNPDRIKALILESAFSETLPLLRAMGVDTATAGISENEGFRTLQKIAGIKTPTIIFHGSRDTLVPIAQAEKLQAASAAKNKQFLVIPGAGHHNVAKTGGHLYFKTIKGFIDTACGINTWRQRRRKFQADQEG